MFTKKVVRNAISISVVSAAGILALQVASQAGDWRAGGAVSSGWSAGGHPHPVSPSTPVVSPSQPVGKPYRIPGPGPAPGPAPYHGGGGYYGGGYYGGAAAAAAGAAVGVAAGTVMNNALAYPQPQPTSPPSSVYIAPPRPPLADPAAPQPNYPIQAGAPPSQPGLPPPGTYCASIHPNYDPMTRTYIDANGHKQICE